MRTTVDPSCVPLKSISLLFWNIVFSIRCALSAGVWVWLFVDCTPAYCTVVSTVCRTANTQTRNHKSAKYCISYNVSALCRAACRLCRVCGRGKICHLLLWACGGLALGPVHQGLWIVRRSHARCCLCFDLRSCLHVAATGLNSHGHARSGPCPVRTIHRRLQDVHPQARQNTVSVRVSYLLIQ
jgi:hypothetical protein